MVTGERRHGFFRNAFDWFLHLLSELVREEMHQQRNIFGPLAQGRHVDGKHIEAIIKIAAELLFSYQFGEVTVGRSHNAYIYPKRARAA